MARFDVGISRDLELFAKGTALGLGIVSGVTSGVGIAFAGTKLLSTSSYIGLVGNALNTGLLAKQGNTNVAILNGAYTLISFTMGIGVGQVTSTSSFLNLTNSGGKTLEGTNLAVDQIISNTIDVAGSK